MCAYFLVSSPTKDFIFGDHLCYTIKYISPLYTVRKPYFFKSHPPKYVTGMQKMCHSSLLDHEQTKKMISDT